MKSMKVIDNINNTPNKEFQYFVGFNFINSPHVAGGYSRTRGKPVTIFGAKDKKCVGEAEKGLETAEGGDDCGDRRGSIQNMNGQGSSLRPASEGYPARQVEETHRSRSARSNIHDVQGH
jgi:hypothetical protein